MKTRFISTLLLIMFLLFALNLLSQNIAITDDDSYTANDAAMLDVKSTSKGLLIPRVALISTSNPISITKPNGLLVWNTSTSGTYSNQGYYFWNGSDWEMVGSNNVFSNALTQSGNTIKLGGNLTENTTVTQGGYQFYYDLTGTGDFHVLDNGSSAFVVRDDGNVGVNNLTPDQKLDVDGNIKLGDNIMVEGNNPVKLYRNLASYYADNSSSSGAFVINTNQPLAECFFMVEIIGYFYDATSPFHILIKAAASVSGFTNASYTTVSEDKLTVTLAENASGNIAIILGDVIDSYNNPRISVLKFIQSKNNIDEDYADGWTITQESSLASYTNQAIATDMTSIDLSDYPTTSEVNALIDAVDFFDQTGALIMLEDTTDNISIGATSADGKLLVQGTSVDLNTAIFEVKNKNGQTVFAVYPEGVRVYIDDDPQSKSTGNRGGFAVGGFNSSKTPGLTDEYFIISRDSARIYYDAATAKSTGNRGGFAVGGFNSSKELTPTNFMDLSPLNYFIGHESGSSTLTGGDYNTFFGYQAGMDNTIGTSNIFIGYLTGTDNIDGTDNTFIGSQSGFYNETGSYNTYLGYQSGYESGLGTSEDASYNTFVGYKTGYNNRNGDKNVFLGYQSGLNNSSAGNNVFIGTESGYYNTTGTNNLFIGYESGNWNATGSYNTYFGYQAGFYAGYAVSTDPNYNTAIGYQAGYYNRSGEYNTYLGYNAGYSASGASGDNNVYIGHSAGYKNTTGHDNVYVGKSAGYDNTTGYNNVFLGLEAGANNTTGYGNVFLGYKAGDDNTAGYRNTFLGQEAGQYNSTGDENVMLGYKAGYYGMGNQNVYIGCNTATVGGSGGTNVFIGYKSGEVFTGSRNVLIGPYTGYQHPDVLSDPNDKLCIGNSASWPPLIHGDFSTDDLVFYADVGINAESDSDYQLYVYTNDYQGYAGYFQNDYNHEQGWGLLIQCGLNDQSGATESRYLRFKDGDGGWMGSIVGSAGDVRFDQASDRRLKENIIDTDLKGLNIINSLRIRDYNFISSDPDITPATVTGFIAQEALEVYPKMVTLDDESGYYGVSQSTLIPVLTKAIQEQQELIEELEKRIKQLEEYNAENVKK